MRAKLFLMVAFGALLPVAVQAENQLLDVMLAGQPGHDSDVAGVTNGETPLENVGVTERQPAQANAYPEQERAGLSPDPMAAQKIVQQVQTSKPSQVVYVQPGETVYALARRHNVQPGGIITENNLRPPYNLAVGQKIRITQDTARGAVHLASYQPPVEQQVAPRVIQAYHLVQSGQTLYSISRLHNVTIEQLVAVNNIPQPYTLAIGQRLTLPVSDNTAIQKTPDNVAQAPVVPVQTGTATPRTQSQAHNVSYEKTTHAAEGIKFSWPVRGQVVLPFGTDASGRQNDGINIAAPIGTPVKSVAGGEVVYRGTDLDGYGNLLLVKHRGGWVSAYAHTDTMLVEKGDKVSKGQVIAKVGATGSVGQPQLHFEMRHDLKPADPVAVLRGQAPLALN